MDSTTEVPVATESLNPAQTGNKVTKVFTGNDDKEMVEAKKKFITVLIKNGEEFGDVLAMAQTVSKLGPACLEFLNNYFAMYALFESEKMEAFKLSSVYRPFPSQHILYDIFLKNPINREDLVAKAIPIAVKQGLYAFYGLYLAPDAAVINPYLHMNIRNSISKELIKMHTTNETSVDIFDDSALIAIETLFWIGYPRYLNYKGQNLSDKISRYQKDWEQSVGITYSAVGELIESSSAKSEISKISGKSSGASTPTEKANLTNSNSGALKNSASSVYIAGKISKTSTDSAKSSPLVKKKDSSSKGKSGILASIFGGVQKETTKEAMVEALQNPKLYKKFEKFVKVTFELIKGQLCEENLLCFQYFIKLEARTRKTFKGELEPCLARFLDVTTEKIDRVTEGNNEALVTMVPLFLFFYGMFVCQGSENEVNIPSKLRNEIEAKVKGISNVMIPMNVFDHVIDHVLELLYLNSFTKYIKK